MDIDLARYNFKITAHEDFERRRDLIDQAARLLGIPWARLNGMLEWGGGYKMPTDWLEDFYKAALRKDTQKGRKDELWSLLLEAQPR